MLLKLALIVQGAETSNTSTKGKVTIITAVAKKEEPVKAKGELMLDNIDAMEVSSPEAVILSTCHTILLPLYAVFL